MLNESSVKKIGIMMERKMLHLFQFANINIAILKELEGYFWMDLVHFSPTYRTTATPELAPLLQTSASHQPENVWTFRENAAKGFLREAFKTFGT
ncbi:hypothetical protein AVEN_97746-1 [Araneus ventricosus]|uniref:Uncharacterized protein n=1 Tax=Araneus ventricosus TaxID=182803 RepID=A0A4Y2E6B8_ARAVE|nr:hypothetical protein AVEN_97746-1 [Araneus ventricosus]